MSMFPMLQPVDVGAVERKQEAILEKLEQQQQQQQRLIDEQREILNELKEHNDKHKVGQYCCVRR